MAEEWAQDTIDQVDTSGWDTVATFDPQQHFSGVKSIYENLDDADNANFRTQVRWEGDELTGWQTVNSQNGVTPSDDPQDYDHPDRTIQEIRIQAQAAANTVRVRGTLLPQPTS